MNKRFQYLGLFLLALLIFPWKLLVSKEKKINRDGGKVQFVVGKDRQLKPMFPIELIVTEEQGGMIDPGQVLSCDIVARSTDVIRNNESITAIETIIKCGEMKFKIQQVIFAESGR